MARRTGRGEALESEKARLVASLDFLRASTRAVEVRPASIDAYRTKIEELQLGLQSGDPMQIAAYEIRSLVTAIEVHPCEERGQVELIVKGVIADRLNLPKRKSHDALRKETEMPDAAAGNRA
ncbi:MAG TPA: hypothetical protein VK181_22940 [Rhizobium sp.]|nr:hypothetical protein [Rhizobium sp.]